MNTIELGGVIQNAIDTARPFIDAQQHILDVEIPDEPIHLRGDAVRLSQVFSNLLDNAAKYSAPGGRISLSARRCGGRLEVTIADNGIGMPAETLEKIFDMFVQGTDAQAAGWTHAGLGVGLGLAKRLVALHGGTIEAASAGPGHGSTFTVHLDVAAAPGAPARAHPGAETDDGRTCHRILLVDDNADFVDSLALLLRGLGHQVRVAYDGPSALEAAQELKPDVAFLDLGLPRMNGYELALELRKLPAAADAVLVAVSGWGQDKDRQLSREHGFAAHLVKPVDVEKVRSALEALVSTH
jgi:CheY-like chemotaxis protein